MTANADITTVMKDKSNEINEIGYDEIEMDDDFGLDADQQGATADLLATDCMSICAWKSIKDKCP